MNKFFKLDWVLNISVLLLLVIGLLALYSISFDGAVLKSGNLKKQIVSILIGTGLATFLAFFDYRRLDFYSTKFYFLILGTLTAVLFFGRTIRGSTGWIGIFDYHIQPVEITKLVMIIFLASFLSRKKNQLSILVRTIVSIILVFVPVFLILKQPDLGSAIIVLASWGTLLSVSGLNKKNLAILFVIGVTLTASSWMFLEDYQKNRIMNFIEPERDPMGSGYNVIQSIVAVGSGGLFGKGLGHGSQSQLNFLPEKHTDFIFSVIAEELGFFGVVAIFTLFGVIFWRLKETARLARDNFGFLIVIGIISMLFFQFLINAGMNIGVMPVTGIPLPFLSYGGSAMVMTLASLGLVQSIYLRRMKT
jgi:rod shape determining protein RodA